MARDCKSPCCEFDSHLSYFTMKSKHPKKLPYGFKKKFNSILKKIGLNKNLTPVELTQNMNVKKRFNQYLNKYTADTNFKSLAIKKKSIFFLKKINCYKGRRHYSGLPVRGQRTKTNSKTAKKRKRNFFLKKKTTKQNKKTIKNAKIIKKNKK